MASLLYITANPKSVENSYSLTVGKAFLETYKQHYPQDNISIINLYTMEKLPYIDADLFSGWGKLEMGTSFESLSDNEKEKIMRINELSDQFVNADKYVFVSPLWNLSIPPRMKAYIDTICIADKTFKYTDNGPVGLLENKKAVHIQACGGIYSKGPAKEFEFGDRYIRAVLKFLGVTDIQSIIVEGMNQFPEKAEEIKTLAIEHAKKVATNFT